MLDVSQKSYTKPINRENKLNTHFFNVWKQTLTKTYNPWVLMTISEIKVIAFFIGFISQKINCLWLLRASSMPIKISSCKCTFQQRVKHIMNCKLRLQSQVVYFVRKP